MFESDEYKRLLRLGWTEDEISEKLRKKQDEEKIELEIPRKPRGRPRKHSVTSATGDYFREFEDSILLYNSLEDKPARDKLFREKMNKPLRLMVQTILRRYYRSRGFPIDLTDEELIVETMSFITGILHRFDSTRGTKCYSYIQTVIKHYFESVFRGYFKSNFKYERCGENVNIIQKMYTLEDVPNIIDTTDDDENDHDEMVKSIINETINDIQHSIENMEECNLTENDCLVGTAIVNILTNYEEILGNENTTNKFNKSIILCRISEMTLLNPKTIKISLKKYKEIYKKSKQNLLARFE